VGQGFLRTEDIARKLLLGETCEKCNHFVGENRNDWWSPRTTKDCKIYNKNFTCEDWEKITIRRVIFTKKINSIDHIVLEFENEN